MGLNFYYYDDLQPKIMVGIIYEHECMCAICQEDVSILNLRLSDEARHRDL